MSLKLESLMKIMYNKLLNTSTITKEYSPEIQKLFLEMMLQDAQDYV